MNITVTFDSLTEVKEFAAMFSRQATEVKAPEPVIPQDITAPAAAPQPAVPIAPAVPVAPIQTVAPVAAVVPAQQPVVPAVPAQSTAPIQPTVSAASPVPAAPVPQAVPTSTRTYTPDELAKAAMQLMDSGRQNELLELLRQFGTNSIPALQPSQYGAFATALRGMGAQI